MQPGRRVGQHVANRPFADRRHLIDQRVVGSVRQCQQLGDEGGRRRNNMEILQIEQPVSILSKLNPR
jgi:hypothetical protein